MEGKNHRIGKADGADMIRKRDSFLKKNFRNTSRKKILLGIARKGGGEGRPLAELCGPLFTMYWSLNLVQVQVARIGEGEVIWAVAERKLFGVWCSRCV